ncbi:MAG: MerR family transcriptional regulator [Saprospiraceae bacterium]
MKKDTPTKLYYSIGEVAEIFGLTTSLIRYWETEFKFLKPHKNAKGERRFTQKNIDQLRVIHSLVKKRGFTLEGARREIENNKEYLKQKMQIIQKLKTARKFLDDLQGEL